MQLTIIVKSKKLFLSVISFSRSYIKIRQDLKKCNVESFRPYMILKWHHGFIYLRGKYCESDVFIKIDTRYNLLINEKIIRETFEKEMVFTPLKLYYKGNYEYLIFKFIKYKTINHEYLLTNIITTVEGMIRAIESLNNRGIIHRDIKLDNFILYKNQIILTDFVYAITKEKLNLKEVELNNAGKKLLQDLSKTKKLCWDDMTNLRLELENFVEMEKKYLTHSERVLIEEKIKLLNSKEGNKTYSI